MYSDLTSYLLINEASINEMKNRIPVSDLISANNFRPNIVIEGDKATPFAEDDWDWIKIGDVVLRNVKPCTRCMIPTIDPKSGIRDKSREPLKTLEKLVFNTQHASYYILFVIYIWHTSLNKICIIILHRY